MEKIKKIEKIQGKWKWEKFVEKWNGKNCGKWRKFGENREKFGEIEKIWGKLEWNKENRENSGKMEMGKFVEKW